VVRQQPAGAALAPARWPAAAPGSPTISCERTFVKEQVLLFTTNQWQTLNSHELFDLWPTVHSNRWGDRS